tara:strand:+ start:150 stop:308 length:159 start_codon:yes stop_codon:yes gene_type:complete
MKASEMICLLAKQIEMNGDREVTLAVGDIEEEFFPRSVTWSLSNFTIEIYGE